MKLQVMTAEAAAAFERKVKAAPFVSCDGSIYHVMRIGMLGATLDRWGCFLETTTGDVFRVPRELAPWGYDLIGMAQMLGNPFPCAVEFNTVNGRLTADLL